MKTIKKGVGAVALAGMLMLGNTPCGNPVVHAATYDEVSKLADESQGTVLEISTARELKEFSSKVNGGNSYQGSVVKLTNDIKLDGTVNNFTPIGNDETPFAGVFDGCGYTISGIDEIYTSANQSKYVGLFGRVTGTVQNVNVKDSTFTGYSNYKCVESRLPAPLWEYYYPKDEVVGLMRPSATDSSIIYGYRYDDICLGGIVAKLEGGEISACSVETSDMNVTYKPYAYDDRQNYKDIVVRLYAYAGGIVGYATDGTIKQCTSNVKIIGTGNFEVAEVANEKAGGYIGGIAGKSENSIVNACVSEGSIKSAYKAGGIVCENSGDILNCRAEVALSDCQYMGGIAEETSGNIYNSCNLGNLGQDSASGGVAYRVSQGNLINNFSVGTANCGIADTVESGGIVQKCYSLETSSNSNFNVMNGTEKEVKACDASYMTSGDFLNKLNENIGDHIDWFDWIVDTQESQNPIISPIINLEDCSVEFGIGTAAIVYDGTPKTIAVTITYNGKTLVEGEDYAVSYQTNVNAGNATAVVTGVGQYSGSDMTSFTIEPRTLADAVITTSASSFTYTGNAMIPNVYVKVGNRTLEKDKDYTITFSNNVQVGTASYVIQGIGNYKESRQGTYEIKAAPENPPAGGTPSTGGSSNTEVNNQGTGNSVTPLKVSATKITKVTGKKKSFVVKWKKMSKVAGYQIRYSTKKSMGGAKKKTISSKKSSVTVKNLKSKKKYYVQVRVYKVDSNQNSVYSSWSARKMIKTK